MRLPWKKDHKPSVDDEIERILAQLSNEDLDSDEYAGFLVHLEKLIELKAINRPSKMSRDMMAQIAGNLAGILIVVIFEQKGTITSKAFGEILRARRPTP